MTNLSAAIPIPEMGMLSGLGAPPVERWKASSAGSEIQGTLVPTIAYAGARLEAYAKRSQGGYRRGPGGPRNRQPGRRCLCRNLSGMACAQAC